MNDKFEARLETLDRATLTPLVRHALGSETVEVIDWDYRPIHGGAGLISSIYRFSGKGRDRGETAPWSLILKVIRARPEADDPSDVIYYWKREVLAYQSGLLDDLPGGVAAPRCFGVVEHPGEGGWMWLEEVTDDVGSQWPLEHYGLVARQFGQFNGAYLVGRPLPSWPWLSRGWLRAYVAQASPAIAQLHSSLEHSLIRRLYPGRSADDVFRLWAERETFLDALDRLPHTLCHLDVFRRNLFARRSADGQPQTVTIDWAFVGSGAIGEEIAPLVTGNVVFGEVELAKAWELDEIVFKGYLEGLRDAGWRGDPRLVRLGYTVASALRYSIGGMGVFLPFVLDEERHPRVKQVFGRSIEEVVDSMVERRRFLSHTLVDEARQLLDSIR